MAAQRLNCTMVHTAIQVNKQIKLFCNSKSLESGLLHAVVVCNMPLCLDVQNCNCLIPNKHEQLANAYIDGVDHDDTQSNYSCESHVLLTYM